MNTVETKQMKVFRMDDFQWVAHYSEEQALEFYHKNTGVPMDELIESLEENGEIPLTDKMYWETSDVDVKEMENEGFEHHPDSPFGDCYFVTFDWVIRKNPHSYPGFIASTEY
ncbi:hypothetical protein H9635_10185 [Solibacillus sp. A46]|uniref:Uncharacterized protein n=1 Tax=Solibacillus faecavium TaxID=2762221 RepID=A0ABR8XYU3_9BACL|nr:hypothetical protein [Solibacillus faecavium]MBD8037114.1 hypothetical protein [Solibacillus faecavium]